MLKNITKLNNVKELDKAAQNSINGGMFISCTGSEYCPPGLTCVNGTCQRVHICS
ncbi:hypothetical protein [Tenacibaculum agarivorans]|uniref:hypothetical protein n=1 Tax=Tenacibaculum agarivorans TaxID=1908389 RepID=UPI000AE8858E|nr:hypothetical protein [Tenacibaculum agarivorans]